MPRPVALVVEPQPLHAGIYQSVLEQIGVECVCLSEQGVRDYAAHQRCIVVLLDLTARAPSAVAGIEQIRQISGFERTPLILVTDVAVELSEFALVDCLLLPLVPKLLRSRIAMLLALRTSEVHYRGLFEHPKEYLYLIEAVRTAAGVVEDWRYVDVNRNALRVLGATRETLIGKTFTEVVPDRATRLIALCNQVLETRLPHEYETSFGAASFTRLANSLAWRRMNSSLSSVSACVGTVDTLRSPQLMF